MSKTSITETPYAKVAKRIDDWDLRKLTKRFVILGIIAALIGSYFWYSRIYMTNERRFWSAIENSLSTKSVTRTLINGGTGNEVTQSQRFAFSPQMASESKVFFTQKTATVDTSVETEGILFPDAQYSRYVAFETNQKKPDGTIPSLDNLLGKWEANQVAPGNLAEAKLSYVSELVSLVIFGNYDADFRGSILSALRENSVYRVNYEAAEEEIVDGEDVVVYTAQVGLKGYATQVQRAFVEAGYGEFPPLNPENYREDSALSTQIIVNKRNNSIVRISFGDREEIYTGYGILRTIDRPEATYNPGELERQVQDEIQGIL